MDPKLEGLDINFSADEVAEYIDRFNFWIDTREASDEMSIKGAFLTAVGEKAFTMPRTLVYPKPFGALQSQKFKKHFCGTSGQHSLNWSNGRGFTHWSETLMKLCANLWFAYNR